MPTIEKEFDLDNRVLSGTSANLKAIIGMGLAVSKWAVNEMKQQAIHLYLHTKGVTHERFYDDPETSFSYFVKKDY